MASNDACPSANASALPNFKVITVNWDNNYDGTGQYAWVKEVKVFVYGKVRSRSRSLFFSSVHPFFFFNYYGTGQYIILGQEGQSFCQWQGGVKITGTIFLSEHPSIFLFVLNLFVFMLCNRYESFKSKRVK
jgi:hypothetical protein